MPQTLAQSEGFRPVLLDIVVAVVAGEDTAHVWLKREK